jgi:hypothetical protein
VRAVRGSGSSGRRQLAALVLSVVAAVGWLGAPVGVVEVRAASPDLTIVTNARYDVQPDQHRVRVTLDMVMTNHLHDTTTKRFFFDRAFLSVLPGTSAFKLTWSGSGSPKAVVTKRTSAYTMVRLDLAQRIYSGKTATYQLHFDLVDPGGKATRDIRIGSSLASFPVWAFATDATPGSTVRVVFPAGFQAEVGSGDIPAPTTDSAGRMVFQTGKLSQPLTFFAYLIADRPGAYAERSLTTTVGSVPVDLAIMSWQDDKPWAARVGGLVVRALPVLSTHIGLPWPRQGGLTVHEAVSRSTGGYAGLFDPSLGQVDVAYYADDFVVLHESAHSWFNGSLLVDRWANEAFASYYALDVAPELKVKAVGDALTPALKAARIPLNAWGAVGREDAPTEDYAYAATLALARAIAERAGADGLRAVWADAAGRIGAYQPPVADGGATSGVGGGTTAPETVAGPPDWRGLLDLLDAHSTSSFDDLWRTWVARDSDLPLLDARKAARARYDAVVDAAGEWQLPRAVRDAMRAWRFDQATVLLDDATKILDQRTAIAARATTSGLTTPTTLQTAFESPDGFASATLEATAELEAIGRYDAAAALRPATVDLVQTLGLWGTTPERDLDQARAQFATGDLTASVNAAASAEAIWSSAEDIGRGRLISIVVLIVALLLAVVLFAVWLRGRRRRPGLVGAPDPYATLAATPDSGVPVALEDAGEGGAKPD